MHRNCPKCSHLWSEYALATRHYLKVEGRLRIANSCRDDQRIRELSPMLERAAGERVRLWQDIKSHESERRATAASA